MFGHVTHMCTYAFLGVVMIAHTPQAIYIEAACHFLLALIAAGEIARSVIERRKAAAKTNEETAQNASPDE